MKIISSPMTVVPLLFALLAFLQPQLIDAEPLRSLGADECEVVTVFEDGFVLPDGGILGVGISDAGHINHQRDIVTDGTVLGVDRNQGVFVIGPGGVREIIRGCGSTGGQGNGGNCGDPTPIGGTFGGLFDFNRLEPRMNDQGDVIFLADVTGGSSARGLFIYQASNQTISKIVALGDPSPRGGFIEAMGNGVINNDGHVAFLAWDVGTSAFNDGYLAVWDGTSIEVVLAAGDVGPGGVIIENVILGTGGFVDGTDVVLFPTPAFGDDGRIATTVDTPGGDAIVLIEEGVTSWLVRAGDPMPGGGNFTFIGTPSLRDGLAAFEAANPNSLLVGTPGNWQRAWTEGDVVDGIVTTAGDVTSGRHILDENGGAVLTMLGEVDGETERILARWRPGVGLTPLLISTGTTPGGDTVVGISQEVSINRQGDVAFQLFNRRKDGTSFTGLYRIDNCGLEIFSDDFENGNTAAWTFTQP